MRTPEAFRNRMNQELGGDYDAIMAVYEGKPRHGIRLNTLKIDRETFLERCPFDLEPVPWDENGFLYDPLKDEPSRHPFYHAGLYYIQEPSAMAPAVLLNPEPGHKTLDLCAAPGGKSIQLASLMEDRGLLVCNDIHPKRVRALLRNLEWFGIKNVMVLNEAPENLASRWQGLFDRVLVDAPCSGEGMFRRDTKAAGGWERFAGSGLEALQKAILSSAGRLVAPGGALVYSTCTFGRSENEAVVSDFLRDEGDFSPDRIPGPWKVDGPLPGAEGKTVQGMGRIWPHRHKGEGHFMARLVRKEKEPAEPMEAFPERAGSSEEREAVEGFWEAHLKGMPFPGSRMGFYEGKVYIRPEIGLPPGSFKFVRNGWLVGQVAKGRFVPSQALARGIKADEAKQIVDLDRDEVDALKYLKGETLARKADKGWNLVCVEGYPLGWAKSQGAILKNCYTREWRMR